MKGSQVVMLAALFVSNAVTASKQTNNASLAADKHTEQPMIPKME
jgi:hypothetical protein